jgi:hypothetical protein
MRPCPSDDPVMNTRRTSSCRDHPADDPEWFSCASRASPPLSARDIDQ